nr:retrotransposon protein, putative, Ty1-copia subclass [Tanacetum cinerariifolium]
MGIGVSSNVVAAVASLIGCSILTAPFNYLGVKVGRSMSKITSWDDVVSKDDSWLGEVALKVLYKKLYALEMCKSINVAEKIGHPSLSHFFRRMPRGGVEQENYGLLFLKVVDLLKFQLDDLESFPSRRDNDLEDDHIDTLHSENTSEIPVESESLGSPPELILVRDLGEPANYKADMLDPDKVIWQGAMDEEMNSMKVMKVWIVVDLPFIAKVVRIKWLYKKKTDMDVSRYQQNPVKLHWVAVIHILKYLRNTRDMFLVYGVKPDTELDVTSFCNASWQCDKDDTKSQMGYVFVVNRGAVDWKSKKQTTIAMHSAQAKYVDALEAAMEAVWIGKFVGDLGVMPSINKPINMYCDNSAAIIFANEPGIMKGARHFLQRYHYIREQVETGEIKLIKVHTDDNLADSFNKALPRGMVIDHAKGIGLQLAK